MLRRQGRCGQKVSYLMAVCGLREIGSLSQGGGGKKDLALGDIKESRGDSQPILLDIGEIGGSCGATENQYTVEDRRGIAKRYNPNGYSN